MEKDKRLIKHIKKRLVGSLLLNEYANYMRDKGKIDEEINDRIQKALELDAELEADAWEKKYKPFFFVAAKNYAYKERGEIAKESKSKDKKKTWEESKKEKKEVKDSDISVKDNTKGAGFKSRRTKTIRLTIGGRRKTIKKTPAQKIRKIN